MPVIQCAMQLWLLIGSDVYFSTMDHKWLSSIFLIPHIRKRPHSVYLYRIVRIIRSPQTKLFGLLAKHHFQMVFGCHVTLPVILSVCSPVICGWPLHRFRTWIFRAIKHLPIGCFLISEYGHWAFTHRPTGQLACIKYSALVMHYATVGVTSAFPSFIQVNFNVTPPAMYQH